MAKRDICLRCAEEHSRKMQSVIMERCQLATDLNQKLGLQPVEATELSRKLHTNVQQVGGHGVGGRDKGVGSCCLNDT